MITYNGIEIGVASSQSRTINKLMPSSRCSNSGVNECTGYFTVKKSGL